MRNVLKSGGSSHCSGTARGDLHPFGGKLAAVLDGRIVGVADHDAGRLETRCGNAFEASFGEERADLRAEFPLPVPGRVETERFGFHHRVTEMHQRIRRHGGVIGVPAAFIGLHDRVPFGEVAGEAGALGFRQARERALAEHDQAAGGLCAPALLRCADKDIDARCRHIHPDRPRCDAVKHEQAADGMSRLRYRAQVVVRQDDPGRGFDMGARTRCPVSLPQSASPRGRWDVA